MAIIYMITAVLFSVYYMIKLPLRYTSKYIFHRNVTSLQLVLSVLENYYNSQ